MAHAAQRKASLAFGGLAGLMLASLLWAGCAAHSYPGPIHGLTFDGTVQSIDLTNQTLALLPVKPSEPLVFGWNKTTKFWKNGIPIRPNQVEPGVSVRVHVHTAPLAETDLTAIRYIAHHVYVLVPYAPEY